MATYARASAKGWRVGSDTTAKARARPGGWEVFAAAGGGGGSIVGPGLLSSPLLSGRLLRGLVR